MEEPSVLDYVKAKLAFWKHSAIEVPQPEQKYGAEWLPEEDEDGIAAVQSSAVEQMAAAPKAKVRVSTSGLMMAAGALVLALIAQGFLEPPNRAVTAAAILYAIAAVLIGSAYFRNLVVPSNIPEDETIPESLAFRKEGLIVGLVLMALTFWTFGTPDGQDVPRI